MIYTSWDQCRSQLKVSERVLKTFLRVSVTSLFPLILLAAVQHIYLLFIVHYALTCIGFVLYITDFQNIT